MSEERNASAAFVQSIQKVSEKQLENKIYILRIAYTGDAISTRYLQTLLARCGCVLLGIGEEATDE